MLLEETFINVQTPMIYICVYKNESKITMSEFQNGGRCKECDHKKVTDKLRKPYEEVKTIFEKEGCKLLETEYINNKQDLNYICACGNKSKIRLNSFLQGQRCKDCGNKKIVEEVNEDQPTIAEGS